MAGFTPTEGEKLRANLLYKNADVDRGTSLQLGLFTNVSPGESITEATITEPTGGSYARKTLADASWSVDANGVATYAEQTFTPVSTDYTGSVQGYFIATTGTTPRIIAIEVDPDGPFTILAGQDYKITPSISQTEGV